jgi:hypothetical protein
MGDSKSKCVDLIGNHRMGCCLCSNRPHVQTGTQSKAQLMHCQLMPRAVCHVVHMC